MSKQDSYKIIYVLVSSDSDYFTEMAILSIYCARKFSPNTSIEVVVDKETYKQLKGFRKTVLDLVDRFHIVDAVGRSKAFTSRMIKTQLRKLVSGDYLYIDIDAVPVADLSDIFNIKNDLAMVNDYNLPPEKFIFYDYEKEIFEKMNWPLPIEYFNSGVMFVKDNEEAHAFFELWHKLWLQSSALSLHKDQPAMHEAIRLAEMNVKTLDYGWNLLIGIQRASRRVKEVKIYHYSTINFESRIDTYFHEIVKNMKVNNEINTRLLVDILHSRYPWTNKDSLRLNWAVGNYHKLPVLFLKRIFRL